MSAKRHAAAAAALLSALVLAACGGPVTAGTARDATAARVAPEHVVPAPNNLIAAAEPQPNGIMWVIAGNSSVGLFELGSASGKVAGSVPVSSGARSVAESAGVLGLALATRRSGALQLLNGQTAKLVRTVALPAPARQVVPGSDGTTFYVLTAWPASASVTIVNSRNGKLLGNVPVPADTASIAPDIQQTTLYVLQRNGVVDAISITSGQITARFRVGDTGLSIALSPDGSTLYVLKGTGQVFNVAVVDVRTESVRRVVPAPSHCRELVVSATGSQLYEVVGTSGYGNIQVFPA